MKIAWDKSKLAIEIKCKGEKEFDKVMHILGEKTTVNFSIEPKE